MKGLSPAQASQAAAGTSAMRLTTFTARLSLPSGIRRPPGLQMLPHQMTPIGQQTRGSIRLQKPGVLQRGDLRLEALKLGILASCVGAPKIGRSTCRKRVCQSVQITVV